MKVTIDHHVVVSQSIELPDKCPKCSTEFKEGSKFKVWEYQDQGRHAVIEEGGEDFDWPNLPNSGESWIYLSWECSCGYTIAEANEFRFDLDEPDRQPPPGLLDLLRIDVPKT